tara:strand:- start:807 stop:1493 length:687 start_codon:yes stop_codon:yes gene_type:complete
MIFVAEIGLNHNGNLDFSYELIKQAKFSGADIAKFQFGWRNNEGEINHISEEMFQKIKKWCKYLNIEFMVSIFSKETYEIAKKYNLKRYKIASRTLKEHFNLVELILAEGKETFVSLGMWDGDELPFNDYNNVKFLWCKSKYPCEPWDLTDLPKDFKNSPFDGYSDHSIGIETPLLAISRGAKIIEKHFTLDKSDTTVRDHALSATPEEFKIMTQIGRDIYNKLQIGV